MDKVLEDAAMAKKALAQIVKEAQAEGKRVFSVIAVTLIDTSDDPDVHRFSEEYIGHSFIPQIKGCGCDDEYKEQIAIEETILALVNVLVDDFPSSELGKKLYTLLKDEPAPTPTVN